MRSSFRSILCRQVHSRLAGLAADFGYDAWVVVYLRRQDHLLGMHYGQYIKGSSVHDVDFEEFAAAFAPRLDSLRILAAWVSAFGPERVQVRAYERPAMPGGIVTDFFEHSLARPVPATWTEPERDAESVNRSLGRDYIEYIRILNRRTAREQTAFAREDVLAAAHCGSSTDELQAGIGAWLSPASRRELLAAFAEGNAAIARQFVSRPNGRLFEESVPEGDEQWRPYEGLTAERATAISLAIHEMARVRQPGCAS